MKIFLTILFIRKGFVIDFDRTRFLFAYHSPIAQYFSPPQLSKDKKPLYRKRDPSPYHEATAE